MAVEKEQMAAKEATAKEATATEVEETAARGTKEAQEAEEGQRGEQEVQPEDRSVTTKQKNAMVVAVNKKGALCTDWLCMLTAY